MALFKIRKAGDEPVSPTAQAESVEALRRRARHRLIGAAVLVLIGVAGFPLLFDTQPRPIAVDIPIEIPDRNKARPLPAPTTPAVSAVPAAAAAKASASVVAAAPAEAKPEVKTPPKPEPRPEPKPAAKPEPKAEAKVEARPAKPEAKPAAKPDDGAKARALLEGKESPAAADGRFIVQVGAFSDAAKARETRQKVERAGLKTYTHVADTSDGKRIRVRVGPFGNRADADKAAQKIKSLDLPASVLTL